MAEATTETSSGPYNYETIEDPPPPPLQLSRQIHIIGFTTKARFIAHSLAHIPQIPPVRMLTHHYPSASTKWFLEGKAIDLHDARGNLISSHPILCPEYIGPRMGVPTISRWQGEVLDNIIVNTSSVALYPTLRALRHCIDNRTVICLIHEGLGVAEKLNEDVFDDPAFRPTYVLGHLTHKLSRHMGKAMALRNKSSNGVLLLSTSPRAAEEGIDEREDTTGHRSLELAQRRHIMGLLSTSEALHPVGLSWTKFLHRKLPGMIWSAAADTTSVILGCRYDQILEDSHARKLWNGLLDETLHIAASLPEFQAQNQSQDARPGQGQGHEEKWLAPFLHRRDQFRASLGRRLRRRRTTYSEWISAIRRGDVTPVNFVNGYFVKRAQELGLDHKINSMAVSMVKARHQARLRELRSDIPFGYRPYMSDGDRLGGREFEGDDYGGDGGDGGGEDWDFDLDL